MNAVFRCDAYEQIGFGHLSRCIALAEAFRLFGIGSTFAGMFDPAARQKIAISDFKHVSLSQPVNTEKGVQELSSVPTVRDADFIVIDSYRADEGYLSDFKSRGKATVVIDDFRALEAYTCDVIMNFTVGASSLGYPDGPTLLLGPQFLPARRQLVDLRPRSIERQRRGPVRNLLVAIGGSDPKGIAARIVRVLHKKHRELCLCAISENQPELSTLLNDFSPVSRVLPRQPDLSKPLLWADAAITGGGMIKYESAYMGVPAAAIAQNDGQDGESKALSRRGLVFDLGLADSLADEQLESALHEFLSDAEERGDLAERMRETFVPDPAMHAARAILEALRH